MSSRKDNKGSRSNTPSKPKNNHKNHACNNAQPQIKLTDAQEQAFQDALEDVHTRFILNLPAEELATSDRLFFQIEQAWWFYEDFVCDDMDNKNNNAEDPTYAAATATKTCDLPRFKNVKPFARKLFEISPLLSPLLDKFDSMWKDFTKYRRKISTYGTILLNKDCTKVVMCEDWNTKTWTFPAGKVNQNERGMDAAARETWEETGFDPNCQYGETKSMKIKAMTEREANINNTDESTIEDEYKLLPWGELQEKDKLVYVEDSSKKRRTCYVCWGVPEDFPFLPVSRKEVRSVGWHDLQNLPRSYAAIPFMAQLKKWIKKHSKNQNRSSSSTQSNNSGNKKKEKKSRDRSNKKKRSNSQVSSIRSNSQGRDGGGAISVEDDLFESGLGDIGDERRWDEEEMFRKNEALIGRKIQYDGNPQQFATKGFDGVDPHAFRVVGGEFMNTGGIDQIAKPPEQSQLQPLFRRDGDSSNANNGNVAEDDDLKPFFSDSGASPWGDVVVSTMGDKDKAQEWEKTNKGKSIVSDSPLGSNENTNALGLAILSSLRGSNVDKIEEPLNGDKLPARTIPAVSSSPLLLPTQEAEMNDSIFLTDKEVTARSQETKLKGGVDKKSKRTKKEKGARDFRGNMKQQGSTVDGNLPMIGLKKWVDSLPKSEPTKHFGDFRFNVDAIMKAMKSHG